MYPTWKLHRCAAPQQCQEMIDRCLEMTSPTWIHSTELGSTISASRPQGEATRKETDHVVRHPRHRLASRGRLAMEATGAEIGLIAIRPRILGAPIAATHLPRFARPHAHLRRSLFAVRCSYRQE